MPGAFYLGPFQHEVYWDPNRAAVGGILQFITAFILYGYLIPISLYVTVEIVKVIQAFNISQVSAAPPHGSMEGDPCQPPEPRTPTLLASLKPRRSTLLHVSLYWWSFYDSRLG